MLFFLTCSLPEELYRFWLTDCSAQEEWENMIRRLHQVHILSLPLHLFFFFFLCIIHPVFLEFINWNYNSAKWPSVYCFLWSVVYIKHVWLWLANSICDLIILWWWWGFFVLFCFLNEERWSGCPKKILVKTLKWLVTEWLPVDCHFSLPLVGSGLDALSGFVYLWTCYIHPCVMTLKQSTQSVCFWTSLEKLQVSLSSVHHLMEGIYFW